MTRLASRIVTGEKIAIQAPSREFGERVRADSRLNLEYIDLSNRVTKFFSEALRESPVITCDNVTEYLFGIQAQQANEKWDLRDLPVVVPPFPSLFIETSAPRQFDNPDITAWGALLSRVAEVEMVKSEEVAVAGDVRWLVEMVPVWDDRGVLRTYPCIWEFFLDADGRLLSDKTGDILFETATLVEPELSGTVDGNEHWEALKDSIMILSLPFFHSFAFGNCRNVELKQQEVSRQVRRQAERKGFPLLDYWVLEIEPVKKALRDSGRIAEVGPRKAIRLIRGHFKNYGPDAPLFGQHVGTWWWEGSVRESLSREARDRDYEVLVPKEDQ